MSYSDAVNEAFASSPVNDTLYDTIELIHPSFTDDNGNPTTIRAISGATKKMCRMEEGAPENSGQLVEFLPIPFKVTLPGFAPDSIPSIRIDMDNVTRQMSKHVEEGVAFYDPIVMVYRPYLESNRLNGPELNPPYIMELGAITLDTFKASATATLTNIGNRGFPSKKYTPDVFRGLSR